MIILTERNRYPITERVPANMPIIMAPYGPIMRLHTDPTATPPAKVEFWMCTMSNLLSLLTNADTTKAVTVAE